MQRTWSRLSLSSVLTRVVCCDVVVACSSGRALGDFYAHQFGLTWEPSISIKRLSAADHHHANDTSQVHNSTFVSPQQTYTIVVASDGVWDCFDESHQLLTEDGFKFVHEVQAAQQAGGMPRIATYNEATKALEYRHAAKLIVKDGEHEMVDYMHADEAARWEASSDDFGRP